MTESLRLLREVSSHSGKFFWLKDWQPWFKMENLDLWDNYICGSLCSSSPLILVYKLPLIYNYTENNLKFSKPVVILYRFV